MKTLIFLSAFVAAAYAAKIVAREPQPAAFYAGIGEDAKAAILAARNARAGVNLARQYNCDGACILANAYTCDNEGCEEGIDANWFVDNHVLDDLLTLSIVLSAAKFTTTIAPTVLSAAIIVKRRFSMES
jgi:hypothetical protein